MRYSVLTFAFLSACSFEPEVQYRGQPISSWLTMMADGDFGTSATAWRALAEGDSALVPSLVRELDSSDPRWRMNARLVLGTMCPSAAAAMEQEARAARNPAVREELERLITEVRAEPTDADPPLLVCPEHAAWHARAERQSEERMQRIMRAVEELQQRSRVHRGQVRP